MVAAHVLCAEHGVARDEDIDARGDDLRRVRFGDAAVHLDIAAKPAAFEEGIRLLRLCEGALYKLLPAAAGVYAHDQQHIGIREDVVNALYGGIGANGKPRPLRPARGCFAVPRASCLWSPRSGR